MVEFYRDHPEYEFKEAKYVLYFVLFEDVVDHKANIHPTTSNGWATENSSGKAVGGPKGGVINFVVNGEVALSVKKVSVTITNDGEEAVYDSILNPEVVRLAFEDAGTMGRRDDVVWNNGVPDLENTPQFWSVKCMFNSFPSDTVDYKIEVIDSSDQVIKFEQGTINIVDPPWATS